MAAVGIELPDGGWDTRTASRRRHQRERYDVNGENRIQVLGYFAAGSLEPQLQRNVAKKVLSGARLGAKRRFDHIVAKNGKVSVGRRRLINAVA